MTYALSTLDEAKAGLRASDARAATRELPAGSRDYAWVAARAARGRETRPRLAAVMLHDTGDYNAAIVVGRAGREGLGVLALLRLLHGCTRMFVPSDEGLVMLRVEWDEGNGRDMWELPAGFAPTASLPAYACEAARCVMLVRVGRPAPGRWWWDRGPEPSASTVVTALLTPRRESDAARLPTHARAMRTVMTTSVRADGTLDVGFWPPVGAWLADGTDTELRVWLRVRRGPGGGGGGYVDLLDDTDDADDEVQSTRPKGRRAAYPRLCKMNRHAPDPATGAEESFVVRGRKLHIVAGVSVQPEWPGRSYREEGARLWLLGRAPEVSRRHAAARSIQAAWREAASSPGRAVCRRRLLREFGEMLG
jgi:hypothetical protein